MDINVELKKASENVIQKYLDEIGRNDMSKGFVSGVAGICTDIILEYDKIKSQKVNE